jgi:spore maturation protein CgeB
MPGLVRSMDSVELLAIRRCRFEDSVMAKVRLRRGDFADRVFITKQPKTEEEYSPRDYSPDEIASMKRADEERDRTVSPNAHVVAEVEGGRVHPVEPVLLVEPEPYDRFKPFMGRKRP